VAAVLYAIGFAEFAVAAGTELWSTVFGVPPPWLTSRSTVVALALSSAAAYALSLARKAGGGGNVATVGKVIVFAVLVLAGLWALGDRPRATIADDLTPFFAFGAPGLLQAMGATFIALQGFDLIAAVGGEVKEPARNIPRAMLISLGLALAIYLPLLFVVATVGTEPGVSIVTMAERHPATVMADAAERFMGRTGFWLVMVAAILSTLSALQANLLAASRVALTMAHDRTLPRVLARIDERRNTPIMAVYATFIAVAAIVLIIPDLAQAGAAASLIFLVAFALAHITGYLARRREEAPSPYRTPAFPVVPVVGGLACAAMAAFQAIAVPAAGGITALWLALGGILYFALFAGRAEALDAFAQAQDPALSRLRGKIPLVLVPVANPQSAPGLVAVANSLTPDGVGKVLLLTVMRPPSRLVNGDQEMDYERLDAGQLVMQQALRASWAAGQAPEALLTTAEDAWDEIERVARTHRCESLVLGLSELEGVKGGQLEKLLNRVQCEVVVVRAPPHFDLKEARNVLVPIGGRGRQDEIRARLLGALTRHRGQRRIRFCAVVEEAAPPEVAAAREQSLQALADDEAPGAGSVEVVRSDDVIHALVERGNDADLVVLGLQQHKGQTLFGELSLRIAAAIDTATLMIRRRR